MDCGKSSGFGWIAVNRINVLFTFLTAAYITEKRRPKRKRNYPDSGTTYNYITA